MKFSAVSHTGIVVSDLDLMIDFFDRALGFKLQARFQRPGELAGQIVGLPGAAIEVAIMGSEASPQSIEFLCYHSHPERRSARQSNHLHANHIAVATDDAIGMIERAKAAGGRPFTKLVTMPGGAKSVCYLHDPEGGIIEIIQVHDPENEYPAT